MNLLILCTLFIVQFIGHRIWLKTFIETKIAGNKNFDISSIPSFVIIEIDQTIHYTRILIISAIIAYFI
jgi:hypothetical protein